MNIHIVESAGPFEVPTFEGAFSTYEAAQAFADKAEAEHEGVDYSIRTVILDALVGE